VLAARALVALALLAVLGAAPAARAAQSEGPCVAGTSEPRTRIMGKLPTFR